MWRYRHDRFGIVKITGFVSPTEVTATVERRLPDSVVSVPTHRWAHGLFSAEAGWPHLVILWRGRLWFFRDFELAGSVAGDYRNFAEFDESGMPAPDMAIRRRLDLTDIPIWVRADRQNMMIGTARGEYIIGPRNAAEAISADNIDVVPHTAHGSAQVWPLTTAGEVIFTQRGGRKVRAAKYSFAEDRYLAPPVTLWARQITQSGVRQLAFQAEPEELLWALRADGTAVAHPYSPDQDTKGWARALSIEGAKIVSICCIPSPDGARDDLWLLVDRDGEVSIQQLAGWWDEDAGTDIAEAFFVDDGATFSGTPATQFSVPWLEGAQTLILADGAEHPPQIVPPGGLLTIPVAASVVTLGRPYTARLTTLRPEIPRRDGSGQGRAKRVVALIASLIDSFSVLAGSINGRLDRLVKRAATDPMTPGPPMFSGWTDNRAIGGGNDKDGRVTLEDRSPFPWILTATVSKIEEGDR